MVGLGGWQMERLPRCTRLGALQVLDGIHSEARGELLIQKVVRSAWRVAHPEGGMSFDRESTAKRPPRAHSDTGAIMASFANRARMGSGDTRGSDT